MSDKSNTDKLLEDVQRKYLQPRIPKGTGFTSSEAAELWDLSVSGAKQTITRLHKEGKIKKIGIREGTRADVYDVVK